TIDPNSSLMVTEDLRVRKYPTSNPVRLIRKFQTVLDALTPLDAAMFYCEEHGHEWLNLACVHTNYGWNCCLTCGAEQVWFPDTGECLIWPNDAKTITERTAGALPTLHG